MMYFKIDGEDKLVEFSVGTGGIFPKVGETVSLRNYAQDYVLYDVMAVKFYYERLHSGYTMENVVVELFKVS